MTETLEQIALRIRNETYARTGIEITSHVAIEFAKRLAEALNAQEPVAYWCKHKADASPHRLVTSDSAEAKRWATQFKPDFAEVVPLYAAPKPGEAK